MEERSVPGFQPSVNGFHFANSFPHEPLLGVSIPGLGPVSIGDAANGICGGMVYTVRDLFEAGCLPGAENDPPASGSVEFEYLVSRLVDSFNLPTGPMRYFELMNPMLPDATGPLGAVGVHGRPWVMIDESWPDVRGDIDAGILSPLGLIRVLSSDPRKLGQNHQVLAYRYAVDGNTITIGVYDPNHPGDDTVTLSFDASNPLAPTAVTYSAADAPVYCFIRSEYAAHDPLPWRAASAGPRMQPV